MHFSHFLMYAMCNMTKKEESTLRRLERVCASVYTCPYLLESVICLKCNSEFIVFKALLCSVTYIHVVIWRKIANCKNSSNGQKYVLTNFSVTFDIVLQIARKSFRVLLGLMHLRSNILDMKCCLIDDFNIDDV